MSRRGPSGRDISNRLARLAVAGLLLAGSLAARPDAAPAPEPRAPLLVGFYDGWDPAARRELKAHLEAMDVFAPRWITIRGRSATVVVEPDEGAPAAIAALPRKPKLFPIVSNAHDDVWDQPAADAVILDRAAQSAFAARLDTLARTNGYAGYVIDFENLSPKAAAAFPGLLAALKARLSAAGKEVWVTAPIGEEQQLVSLSSAADALVLMVYDECWANSTPGPVAGQDWVAAVLARRLKGLDPRRVVAALASYGYDWPLRAPGRAIAVEDARALAGRTGARIVRDPLSGDAHFAYASAGGSKHEVWFVDAPPFEAQVRAAAALGVRGVALWRIGLEDPAIWSLPRPFVRGAVRAYPADAPLPHPCDPLPPR
jgi:spore germination protein YaaH